MSDNTKTFPINLLVFALVLFALFSSALYRAGSKPSTTDKASFMMECVYGWDQTPDNCREILNGEDPPYLPED